MSSVFLAESEVEKKKIPENFTGFLLNYFGFSHFITLQHEFGNKVKVLVDFK